MPCRVALDGVLVLGGDPCVLPLAVGLPDDVLAAVVRLRREVAAARAAARPAAAGPADRSWLPHLTLSRRLRRDDLADAMSVLERARPGEPAQMTARELRWWDPDRGVTRTLGGA